MLPEIGKISVLFAYLDMEMNIQIWNLIGSGNQVGRSITNSLTNFSSRLAMLENLAVLKVPADTLRFKELATHLRYAADDRNRLLHDEIFSGSAAKRMLRVRRTNPRQESQTSYVYDMPAFEDLAERIERLRVFMGWFENKDPRWLSEPLPSLDKSPTRLAQIQNADQQRAQARSGRQTPI